MATYPPLARDSQPDALSLAVRFGVRLGLEYWTKDQEDVLKLSSDTEKRMPSDTLAHLCALRNRLRAQRVLLLGWS